MDFTAVFREHLKIPHEEFGEKVGVSGAFVSRVATGRDKLPLDRVAGWADALGLQGDQRSAFVEAAHLAKATHEVRALVRRLRLEAAKDRVELDEVREKLAAVLAHARTKGLKIPKGLGDA